MKKEKENFKNYPKHIRVMHTIAMALAVAFFALLITGIIFLFTQLKEIGIVFIVLGFLSAFVFVGLEFLIIDLTAKTCGFCGKSMDGCAYSYQEVRRHYDNNGAKVTIEIRAVCPYCGKEKTFRKDFTIRAGSDNLDYKIDSYCRKKFGH